ncbi:MAG: glycosyltransferase family 2 protein [Proteobacteria bacterium]|nr:glycosyltransferase family 2 protein [Pseudomonadota bacterium]MBU1686339.1 glycosyltransferase family 2 protein [Pseudomonadota bacterium]
MQSEKATDHIALLLSTYNSEVYIGELLASLFAQSNRNFTLLVRDDGSQDLTGDILLRYQETYPENIVLLEENKNLGPAASFSSLAEYAVSIPKYTHFMFADHDDYWLPMKIAKCLSLMKEKEQDFPDTPILVHSDLVVVDENLEIIGKSFWKFQHVSPKKNRINRLLMQNFIPGCTMLMNRKLLEKALPVHPGAIMHDWWVALVASVFGKIYYLNEATILYRQHGTNVTDTVRFGLSYLARKLFAERNISRNFQQAHGFLETFKSELSPLHTKELESFLGLANYGYLQRIYTIVRFGFLKHGIARNCDLLFRRFKSLDG